MSDDMKDALPDTRTYKQVWPTEHNGLGIRQGGVLPTMKVKNKTKRKKK